MSSIWSEAVRILAGGGRFVLAAVVARRGSAPRGVGSVMLIRGDGSIHSSVGGGKIEAAALEAGKAMFPAGGGRFLEFDLAGEDAADAGMICGGWTELFLDCAGREDLPAFEAARQCEAANGRGYLAYDLTATPRRLTFEDECGESGADAAGDARIVRLPMRSNGTAFIFGGGHVGLETAVLAERVDFKVVVLDDREEFVNARRFPGATPILLESFEKLPSLAVDADSYLVIATRGHLHDFTVLDYALGSGAGYIGMIGSRRKRDLTYERLLEKGHPRESLAAVHSPIGLAIGSETPAEIAVSIVAELIRVRAAKAGGGA